MSRLQEGVQVLASSTEHHVRNHQNPSKKKSGFVPPQLLAEGRAGITLLSYFRVEIRINLLTDSQASPTFPPWDSP